MNIKIKPIIILLFISIFIYFAIIITASDIANTLTVDDEGDGDYTHIQKAVDNARKGDIIYVYSGTYNETVTVNKSVSIIGIDNELGSGIDDGLPIVDGSNQNTVFSISADIVTIENIKITGGYSAYFDAGISITSNGCLIKNNQIYGNKYGIVIDGQEGSVIQNNVIKSNQISNNSYGLDLFFTENTVVENNIFNGCGIGIYGTTIFHFSHDFSDNKINDLPLYYTSNKESITIDGHEKKYGSIILINCTNSSVTNMNFSKTDIGVELAFCSKVTIANSTMEQCGFGVYNYKSSYCNLYFNNFLKNRETGILIRNSSNNFISKNMFTHNFDGVRFEYSNNTQFNDNSLSENENDAVYLRKSKESHIFDNTINLNGGGVYSYSSQDDIVEGNDICLNHGNGVFIHNGSKNIISNNYINNNRLCGIELKKDSTGTIIENNFLEHSLHYGIRITDNSNNNQIYHNYFRSNGLSYDEGGNAYDECMNIWNLDYPSNWGNWKYNVGDPWCGNYWQDHLKNDTKKGPEQNQLGKDNVVDTEYEIPGDNNVDHYPILPVANEIYVDSNGDGDFTCIQDALEIATSGTTIHVKNGVYKENIFINNSVRLIGDDKNKTIIDGEGMGDVVTINHDDVTLSRFTIQNCGNNDNAAIKIVSDNNSISEDIICSNNDGGIALVSSSDNTIKNTIIKDNDGQGISLTSSCNNNVIINSTISNNYKGIRITSSSGKNYIADNNICSNSLEGIEIFSSNQTIISNNYICKNTPGLVLSDAPLCTISDNTFLNNGIVFLQFSQNNLSPGNTVKNNIVNGKELVYYEDQKDETINDAGQIILINCSQIHVENQTLTNTTIGLELWKTSNCEIIGNTISKNSKGLYLVHSKNNNIQNNNIRDNEIGILLYNTSTHLLSNNNLSKNNKAVQIFYGSLNNVVDNTFIKNYDEGMEIISSSYNSIENNDIRKNGNGLVLDQSQHNSIHENTFMENDEGILIKHSDSNSFSKNVFINDGINIENSIHNVIENNMVNGKELVYLEDEKEKVIDDAGQIILINCSQINVENQEISNTTIGIWLWKTKNCSIENNKIIHNKKGIMLRQSTDVNILSNTLNNNDKSLSFFDSHSNDIVNNKIFKNYFGIVLENSDENNIENNHIFSNIYSGIIIQIGFNNVISNCVIHDNYNGIQLYNAINTEIINTDLYDNFRGIILYSTSNNNNIWGCDIHDNYWGIKLTTSQDNVIKGCSISHNAGGITRGRGNIIQANNFIDNGLDGMGEADKKNNFKRNYWSKHPNLLPYHVYGKNFDWFPKITPYDLEKTENNFPNKYDECMSMLENIVSFIINLFDIFIENPTNACDDHVQIFPA